MRELYEKYIAQHWLMSDPWYYHVYRLPMLFIAVALASGVWLGGRVELNQPEWLVLAACLLGGAAALTHVRSRRDWAIACTLPAVFLLGIYFGIKSEPPTEDSLSNVATVDWQPCAMRIVVQSAAVWQPNPNHRPLDANSQAWKTQWAVKCVAIRHHNQWQPTTAFSTLTTDGRVDRFLPGDTLEMFGHYRKIGPSANPGGFNFAEQARLEHRFVALRVESEQQLELVESRWRGHTLARLRGLAIREIDQLLARWVRFGKAPLAAALVFGQRQQVDWQDQQELMATGTLHMLSISGLHVEIVAAMLLGICIWFGASHRVTFMCLVGATWAYAGLSGAEPPVVRAAVQVTVFAFARWSGGRTRIGNLLGAAAIVVVLLRASNLENVGVQLSFLAVATIGFFISATRKRVQLDRLQLVIDETLPAWWVWLRWMTGKTYELTCLSAWITLFTCPLIWTNFHVLSPIAVPLNVIISIPLTISMLSGLGLGLLGWIPPIGWACGWLCGVSLSFITTAVALGNQVPGGHVWLPAPPVWWTIMFYGMSLLWLTLLGRQKLLGLAILLVVWIGVGAAPWISGPRGKFDQWPPLSTHNVQSTELRCTFLSVGHGTSVIIEQPTGEVWLYDAGHLGAAERSHQEIAASLWNLKTARIDRLIISHADADHYNASLGLAERFSIGAIISTPQFWAKSEPDIQELTATLKRVCGTTESWAHPIQLDQGAVHFRVLHPSATWQGATDNADSLCLEVEYAGKRILLPGDLEGAGLVQLLTLPSRPCHIVMAPHHGSMSHDPSSLLQWCQPQVVVISGGPRAVRPEVIERYSRIPSLLAITHRDAAIQVRVGKDGQLSTWNWANDQWQAMPLE
ncbi:MAG: ComEC/Rec2 family competence protein [Pirellulaceae bacterium]|nr:ComEC/Rec2 family competence protein [Pirellulaceae bacterium]